MINSKTQLFAIIGNPLGHSLSPFMHNYFFASLKLNNFYIPLEVEKDHLGEAIIGLSALGFQGANVTSPFKEKVIPFLENIDPEAQLVGAINTLVRKEGGFWGYNTDGRGFLHFLKIEKGIKPQGKRILILGSGGAAKAVSISLALEGAGPIFIVNRTIEKANDIEATITKEVGVLTKTFSWEYPYLSKLVREAEIIINTTSLGMAPYINQIPPINPKWLSQGQLVVDLIYNPLETCLIKEAKKQGADVANGLEMLIYQGVLAFKLWTGLEPSQEGVREKLEQYLSGKVRWC